MILIRFLLISLIVYLIIRSFMRYAETSEPDKRRDNPDQSGKAESKRVSKSIGEYVDYEEIKEEKNPD